MDNCETGNVKGCFGRLRARIALAFLCSTGVMELYMSRSNLSIAILEMVHIITSESHNVSYNPGTPFCILENNKSLQEMSDPLLKSPTTEFNTSYFEEEYNSTIMKLTSTQRGNILSAFFFGYGLSAIFGGTLADRYGTKKIFIAAVLMDAIGNLTIPYLSTFPSAMYLLIVIRTLMGIFQGGCYPSLHALISKWIPKDEVARFMSFVYAASSLGTVFTLTICGIIISYLGWKAMFYICGSISLVWLCLWITLMYDDPLQHPRISKKEQRFILETVHKSNHGPISNVPLLSILTSVPLWASHIAHAGSMFGLSFMLSQLPIYFSTIIGFSIKANGLFSSLPFLARFLGSVMTSWIYHFFTRKIDLKLKTWKIILTFFGFGCPGIAIVLVGYAGCNAEIALVLFIFCMLFNGSTYSGYSSSAIEIAPNFAGVSYGISTTFAFFYAMTSPVIAGALTPNETIEEWKKVFWVVFSSYVITGIIYCVFIKTEVQSWNEGVCSRKNLSFGNLTTTIDKCQDDNLSSGNLATTIDQSQDGVNENFLSNNTNKI